MLDYLNYRWSDRETENFKERLKRLLSIIRERPFAFQASQSQPDFRKAVLSSQTSIIYRINEDRIEILHLIGNKTDHPF